MTTEMAALDIRRERHRGALIAALVAITLCLAGALTQVEAAQAGWWQPPQHLTWYWQLQGTVKNGEPVAAYDIDGFENSAAEVALLHAAGRHVICYIDVGTAESFRPDYHLSLARCSAAQTAGRASAGSTSVASM